MTDFLYPFIEGTEEDAAPLLADLAASAAEKADRSRALTASTLAGLDGALTSTADAVVERLRAGGRVHTFGNGGSSTDAAAAAALFTRPPAGIPVPARSLVADHAVVTALANDVGFELVFARQLAVAAGPHDVAIGLSTSGGSVNLLRAFAAAARLGVLRIGLAGYEGGAMAEPGVVDHCLVVHSDSVHRIQEVQAAVVHELWRRVQHRLTRTDGS